MKIRQSLYLGVAAVAIALAFGVAPSPASAQAPAAVSIGATDIGGIVTGPRGPEAGVWVIAETTDLPTRMNKTVVTDDQGRYVIPDLPKANYIVWARGYGLIDSAKTQSEPGKIVNITALPAPNEAAAAQYYPAIYWFAMLHIPEKNKFPGTGTGANGNGVPTFMKSQLQWTDQVKTNGCYACHQLGNKATREIPKELGTFKNSVEAWERRVQSGQAMTQMAAALGRQDPKLAIANLANWTDRIAGGELPFAKPERPQGVERNVVITQWDWADPKAYLHDQISTDKRKPTVNANGKHYGATEESREYFPVFDPQENRPSTVNMPVRESGMETSKESTMAPSPYWGDDPIWDSRTSTHSLIMDEKSQVWFTSRVGKPDNPAFCQDGSNEYSKAFPIKQSTRSLAVYDPKTNTTKLIRTCFNTHHVVLAEDADNTLWVSAGGPQQGAIGWVNRKVWEETGDEAKAQGWAPVVIDTNGNGKLDDYVQPNQAVDPAKDKRLNAGLYGVGVNPSDGTVWGAVLGYPGYVLRFDPKTKLSEVYEPPFPGFGPRGFDIDRNGVSYVPLSSGHLGAFDRRKCKGPLNGPEAAEGKMCPEGWTLTPFPGPQFRDVAETGSAEASYYTWVDQFNTSGLGTNVPMATGNANESLMALVDGKWVNMRVPYPLGFFAKYIDGRIDDPNAGWKGRGLWTTDGNRTPFHRETGKGTLPKIVKFQIRPDPLAP
jgi:cytochrome c1